MNFVKFNNVMLNASSWLYIKFVENKCFTKSFTRNSDTYTTNMSLCEMKDIVMKFLDDEEKSRHFVFIENVLINIDELIMADSIEDINAKDNYREYHYIRFTRSNHSRELELDDYRKQSDFLNDLNEYVSKL